MKGIRVVDLIPALNAHTRWAASVEEHSVAGAESGFGMSARAPF